MYSINLTTFILMLVFSFSQSVLAQTDPGKLPAKHRRKIMEAAIDNKKEKLEECREGKKPPEQCYVLLTGFAEAYSIMEDTETANAYKKEAAELKAKHKELSPSEETVSAIKSHIKDCEGILAEYKKGRRNHRDAYWTHEKLSALYSLLKDPENQQKSEAEMKKLRKKYSDIVSDPPRELSEISAKRQEMEKRQKELKEKPFTPKDTKAVVFRFENDIVLQYCYKMEFYKDAENIDIQVEDNAVIRKISKSETRDPRVEVGKVKFAINGALRQIKPSRVLTFRYPIDIRPISPTKEQKAFLIYSDLRRKGYSGSDEEEYEIIRAKTGKYSYEWQNMNAEFEQFYGIVAINGDIIGQIPFVGRVPDSLLMPLEISTDGKKAILAIGKRFFDPAADDAAFIGDLQELLIWEYPNTIRRLGVKDGSAEVREIRRRHSSQDWEGEGYTRNANLRPQ